MPAACWVPLRVAQNLNERK
uniref:Uncharacterized protein n=1 Tax=Amphimedon queenslandica TaxID=400682 RepID=A0A1X7UHQ6_AMPQE